MNKNDPQGDVEYAEGELFVETAFTSEQIHTTIRAEIEHGIRDAPCAFLGDFNAF